MALPIERENSPTYWIRFFTATSHFTINLHDSVKEKLGSEQLTHDKALEILKQIKTKSDILSFITKPIVLIPIASVLFAASLAGGLFVLSLIPEGIAHLAVRVLFAVLAGVSGGLLGFSVENSIRGFLPQLSEAYRRQSERASEYIKQLEASKDATIVLA